jgi:hypothetical protein
LASSQHKTFMKLSLLLLLFTLSATFALQAQYYIIPLGNFQKAADIEAQKAAIDRDDIEGSPMLMSDWGNGIVKLKSGKAFDELILKFNLNRNVLYFMRNSLTYVFPEPVLECELNYLDEGNLKKIFLRSGYPAIADKDSNTLYQVLAIGEHIHFLKFISKKIAELKTFGTIPTKYYEVHEAYYLFNVKTGSIKSVKTDKSSLLNALPDYEKEIELYTSDKKKKLKGESDLIALINELNKKL